MNPNKICKFCFCFNEQGGELHVCLLIHSLPVWVNIYFGRICLPGKYYLTWHTRLQDCDLLWIPRRHLFMTAHMGRIFWSWTLRCEQDSHSSHISHLDTTSSSLIHASSNMKMNARWGFNISQVFPHIAFNFHKQFKVHRKIEYLIFRVIIDRYT